MRHLCDQALAARRHPLLKDASRGKFDVVLASAIDRLGCSLIDLLGTIQHLEACKVDLYLDQQSIDTTTPTSKLVFQFTGKNLGSLALFDYW